MVCEGCERMAKVEQVLKGNGKSLVVKVESHDELFLQIMGMVKLLKYLWPLLAAGAITQVFGFIERLF